MDELGLSISTAVNAFLRAPVREGGMPFEMRVKTPAPDGKTARADKSTWGDGTLTMDPTDL
ncbi:MAG: type II toxin-antitoxin system RelB/DinJ family antitoxin [Collinsella sp.]